MVMVKMTEEGEEDDDCCTDTNIPVLIIIIKDINIIY